MSASIHILSGLSAVAPTIYSHDGIVVIELDRNRVALSLTPEQFAALSELCAAAAVEAAAEAAA